MQEECPPRYTAEVTGHGGSAPEGCRHDEDGGGGIRVPDAVDIGPCPVGIVKDIVEFVHDEFLARDEGVFQGIDFLGAADNGGSLVFLEVPRLDAHVEPHLPEVEVPFVAQCLDRGGEDDPPAFRVDREPLLVEDAGPEVSNKRLSRSRGGGEHGVLSSDGPMGPELPRIV